jgi:hypothetical protein
MPPRHFGNPHTRHTTLYDDAALLVCAPLPPPLRTAKSGRLQCSRPNGQSGRSGDPDDAFAVSITFFLSSSFSKKEGTEIH